MSLRFPDTVSFRDVLRPSRIETSLGPLEFDGEIPEGLRGTFYRTGPDPKYPPLLGDDNYIHGDGMLSMLRFRDGQVTYRSRYARTPRFLAEEMAGRSLFGDYRNPYTDDPLAAGVQRGTANTNMIYHAGRLLALKEDSPMLEIDPDTLETRTYWTADGALKSPHISAHPKVDPVTGELLTYGFQAGGIATTDLAYYVIGKDGRLAHETWLHTPWAPFMHDFVATENYVVFPVFPVVTVKEKVEAGLPYYWWDHSKPTMLGVLPRRGSAEDVRWFEGPPRFGFHFVNAHEENGLIHIIGCMNGLDAPLTFPELNQASVNVHWAQHTDGSRTEGGPTTMIVDWTVDFSGPARFEEHILRDGMYMEAPRIDDSVATRKANVAWALSRDVSQPTLGSEWIIVDYNCLNRYDLPSGQITSSYCFGPDAAPGEPVFIPRGPGSAEGDGWLLLHLVKKDGPGSQFAILDAEDVAAGPIARIHLPFHSRPAIHGNWMNL